ncbi:MAG TPA: NADH-quinone oxidoreductase subunit L [Gaiellaceae bacterium]|nr:NADH-quinone oxidoreductase subunit L [Gaiellaceae bacterium]
MEAAAWACLISPLAGALLITLAGTRIPRRVAGYISTLSVAVSFVASVIAFFALHDRPTDDRIVLSEAWTWLAAGDFRVPLDILIDPLSIFMMLIVSGVGALIVAYSIGYMDGDDEERRYFAYMSLFVFSMLLLVQSANFIVLLVGWGLVGLSSYLLIGYHHERPSAVAAAKKAFIMNALGDATMALAIFLLFWKGARLGLSEFEYADGTSQTVMTLVALGMLGGAVAKSAQIPLHTWLPDAMEGPTPVSALIHAATMVTAGVYMLVRLNPIFEAAPEVQDLAAGIGALTLLVAGLIALVQTDIKRVIAYSTMSQIGYMFLGAGLGAYVGGMFHLMTHAFFKALLFLAAGIVIHALTGEQDMRNMGGLRRYLPRTRLAFLVGSLALAGIPPLSGFWSKDSILGSALAEGWYGRTLLVVGLAGVFLTGLYTFRMFFLVFEGGVSPYAREHVHAPGHGEGPFSMTSTVAVLTVLAAVGGLIAIPGLWNLPLDWLGPVAEPLVEANALQDYIVSAISVALALAGIGVAWAIYGTDRLRIPRVAWLQRLFEKKFYFDEAYDFAFYRPAAATARGWSRFFERPVIQGSIDAVAGGTRRAGGTVSHTQTGLVRSYALALAFGVAVLILVFVSVRQ